jgi:uncharacterized protein
MAERTLMDNILHGSVSPSGARRIVSEKDISPAMANFQIIAKPNGPICNLDCTYCYYLEKENLYGGQKNFRMKDELLESYILQYIHSQSTPTVTFLWQGGEPTLLGVPFFERVVKLQAKYRGDKMIENAFQTNGTLLDNRWGEFLGRNGFLVGLSIDGPEDIHDAYRADKGGQPTHRRVLRGLDVLKRHGVECNTLTVVNRKSSYKPLEVYRYLKEIGSKYLQFIPIVEKIAAEPDTSGLRLLKPYSHPQTTVSEWSVEPLQYGRFLQTVFDEWVRADVARTFVNIFDVALESWMGMEQSLCVFARTCGSALAMEHNGDLYSCDHFVYSDNKLGNILERSLTALAALPQQVRFGKAKELGLPKDCVECDVRFACNGECPKHRFLKTAAGEPELNYLCAGYKHFFHHIDPYMQFMANELKHERAPANVMAWAHKQQRDA